MTIEELAQKAGEVPKPYFSIGRQAVNRLLATKVSTGNFPDTDSLWLNVFLKILALIFLFRVVSIPPDVLALLPPEPFPHQGFFWIFQAPLMWLHRWPGLYLASLWSIKLCALASFFFVLLGRGLRWSLPFSLVLALVIEGLVRSWAFKFYHQMLMSLAMLFIFSLLFGIYGEKRIRERPKEVQFILLAMICCLYFFSGWSKFILGGVGWVDAKSMFALAKSTRETGIDGAENTLLSVFPYFPWAWWSMAFITLTFELLAPLALTGRLARRFLFTGFILMHVGILYLLRISFLDSIFLCVLFLVPRKIAPDKKRLKLLAPVFALLLSTQLWLGFMGRDFYPFSAMALYTDMREFDEIHVEELEYYDRDGRRVEIPISKIWNFWFMRSFHFVKVLAGRRDHVSPELQKFIFERCDLATGGKVRVTRIKVVSLEKELFRDATRARRELKEFVRE